MNVKTGASFWQRKAMLLLGCAMLILVAIPSVSADAETYTAELTSPSDISNVYNGDTVTIKVTGLESGQGFQLNMTSSDLKTNGGTFTMTNYAMPFAMNPASTLLTGSNLAAPGLSLHVQKTSGGYSLDMSDPTRITTNNAVEKTSYYNISIIGSPATAGQAVSMDFSERGTVTGTPDDPAYLTFVISNTNSGNLRILVPDATVPLDKTLTLRGNRPVPPAPLDGGDSTSGGSVSPGTKTAGVVAPQVVPATVPGQTSQTLQTNQEGQTLLPYDIQTGTNSPVNAGVSIPLGTTVHFPPNTPGTITVTPAPATGRVSQLLNSPDWFPVEGLAVECTPDHTTFNTPVTVTFTLTQSQWNTMMTIARGNPQAVEIAYYDNIRNEIISIPITKMDAATRTLSGTTTHFTVFQVFVKNGTAPASTSAQTYGSLIQETPTTVSVPSVQATQAAKASPTTTPKSPFVPSIAVIAIVGLVGYFVVSRKH